MGALVKGPNESNLEPPYCRYNSYVYEQLVLG